MPNRTINFFPRRAGRMMIGRPACGRTETFPTSPDGKVFTLSEYATGQSTEIPDAWGKPIEFYEGVVGTLDKLILVALDKVTAAASAQQ
ncbi:MULTISPECIES: hypothetical protein [Paraburkholderia]|uniref:Uncharacterized protein n=1 Tax=Paraburkholderia madseniana TaxID=2599607 RepID=A0AAP5ET71_9BURK|nr:MULTISPECIES: hypothetical protein [Paraburkholderia]MCX4151955.1 hypothetical protein [Paraburkholderia madseniana]MDN7154883.1 hypothetical protein [Paraburkholderia sp. WS6]MDQ6413766.1 hypothetical protein [Paraburkholderia madseniana]